MIVGVVGLARLGVADKSVHQIKNFIPITCGNSRHISNAAYHGFILKRVRRPAADATRKEKTNRTRRRGDTEIGGDEMKTAKGKREDVLISSHLRVSAPPVEFLSTGLKHVGCTVRACVRSAQIT